jgi:Ring finger domain
MSMDPHTLITKIAKAFYGDIHGSFLRDRIAHLYPLEIEVRIELEVLKIFLNTLSIHFEITDRLPNHRIKYGIMTYNLKSRSEASMLMKLNVLCIKPCLWQFAPCDFDANLFAENSNSFFVKPNMFSYMQDMVDRNTFLYDRVKQRQFALMVFLSLTSFDECIDIMNKAYHLVYRGWIMDDIYLKTMSPLFFRWHTALVFPYKMRSTCEEHYIEHMQSRNECSLCQERFKKNDIVFNGICNHNFHWKCHSSDGNGLAMWFVTKKEFSCPYCRQSMIS